MINYQDLETFEAKIDAEIEKNIQRLKSEKDDANTQHDMRVYVMAMKLRRAWIRPYLEWVAVNKDYEEGSHISAFCEAMSQFILDTAVNSFEKEAVPDGLSRIAARIATGSLIGLQRTKMGDIKGDEDNEEFFAHSVGFNGVRN